MEEEEGRRCEVCRKTKKRESRGNKGAYETQIEGWNVRKTKKRE